MPRCLVPVVMVAILSTGSAGQSRGVSPAAPTWTLVPDLRLGGADDGPKSFNEIRGVVATKAGTIFVLDFKALEVRVFDAKGTFLRVAARKGAGPGEVEFPNGLAIGNDDVVVVSDPGNGRFSFFSPEGRYLRQTAIPMRGFGDLWSGVVDISGRVADLPVRVPTGGLDPRTNYPRTEDHIRLIAADGKADTVAWPRCAPQPQWLVYRMESGRATSMMMPWSSEQQTALTRVGTTWCTPASEYVLLTGSMGGALKEVVRRTVPPIPVTAADRAASAKGLDEWAAAQKLTKVSGDLSTMPKVKPIITSLFADDRGRVWVRRADSTEVQTTAFDVYDGTGRAVGVVRTQLSVGRMVFIAGDLLYTVTTNADDVPVVVRYRIQR